VVRALRQLVVCRVQVSFSDEGSLIPATMQPQPHSSSSQHLCVQGEAHAPRRGPDEMFAEVQAGAAPENQLQGAFGGWGGSISAVNGNVQVASRASGSMSGGSGGEAGCDDPGVQKPSLGKLLHKASEELDSLTLRSSSLHKGTGFTLDGLEGEVKRIMGASASKS
jgi:hypothetical protein